MMWQVILVMASSIINLSSAECNVCQKNQAACINSTSFYLCFGDREPNQSVLYHCQRGFDCTNLTAICAQTSSQRAASCGDTSLCGMCSASLNYKFACLSRTTFQMCYGAIRPTGQIGKCPPSYVCYGGSSAICVPEDSVINVTCDVVDSGVLTPITPVTSPYPSPTSSPTFLPKTSTEKISSETLTPPELCAKYRIMGLYPTVPNDPLCKKYINCYYSNGIMSARELTCSPGTYFHTQQRKCSLNKPRYCRNKIL